MRTTTATCRKTRYVFKASAEEALARGQKTGHYDASCNVYLCLDCVGYHIGPSSPRSS